MNVIFNLLLILVLFSCASGHRKEQGEISSLYKTKNYDEVLSVIEKGQLKKDKDSKLLLYLEKASAFYGKENYLKVIDELSKAKDLIDKYYTKSVIKSLATSTILNSNFEKFRGSFYEKSLLHYLLVSSYFNIYKRKKIYVTNKAQKKSKDKNKKTDEPKEILEEISEKTARDYLFKARAEVLAWDTFFEEIKSTYKTKTTYHNDLLVKLFGGLIHEEIGTRAELNISLILYQDAYKIFNTIYPNFNTFNKKSEDYFEKAKNSKLDSSSLAKFKDKFEATDDYNSLKNYIEFKILNLAYKFNKSKYNFLKKDIKPDKNLVTEIEGSGEITNITIDQGIIPKKIGKTVNIGLIGLMESSDDSKTKKLVLGIGIPILTAFAMNELGLYPRNRYMTGGEFRAYNKLFYVSAKAMAIEYEVPIIEKNSNSKKYFLVIKDKEKVVKKIELSKIASLGDFAKLALEDTSTPRLLKQASRVAMKYLGAIATAFATYNSFGRDKHGRRGPFAKIAALGVYAMAAKAIAESEKADLRYWSTLPKNVLQSELKLPSGSYEAEIIEESKEGKTYKLGQLNIVKGKKNIFTYHRPDII